MGKDGPTRLKKLRVTQVSLVDAGSNPHATVEIYKSADGAERAAREQVAKFLRDECGLSGTDEQVDAELATPEGRLLFDAFLADAGGTVEKREPVAAPEPVWKNETVAETNARVGREAADIVKRTTALIDRIENDEARLRERHAFLELRLDGIAKSGDPQLRSDAARALYGELQTLRSRLATPFSTLAKQYIAAEDERPAPVRKWYDDSEAGRAALEWYEKHHEAVETIAKLRSGQGDVPTDGKPMPRARASFSGPDLDRRKMTDAHVLSAWYETDDGRRAYAATAAKAKAER